ncbi:hypothetical protein GCM10010182_02890 [Actinomadura cremea]|nr:hypothetical protein GCM10010182_02890 [Actinomadura cremea]
MKARWTLAAAAVGLALCGAALAPHDPSASVGAPWAPPAPGTPLGTDSAGRDVLSRLLAGGRALTATALAGAAAASLLGLLGGLATGWAGRRTARWARAVTDLLLALPFLLVALVLAAALPAPAAVIAATVCGGAPLGARMIGDLVRRAHGAGHVEAARGRGEGPAAIAVREVLPSLAGAIPADAVARFVLALQLAAAFGTLGLGTDPAAPDWGASLRENLPGAALNPWSLTAPAAALTAVALATAAAASVPSRPGGFAVGPARRAGRRPFARGHRTVRPDGPGPAHPNPPAIDHTPDTTDAPRELGLTVDGLTVVDADGRAIVDGIGLRAAPGEVVAIVGPSGGGKTTAVRAALDVLAPGLRRTGGTVTWHGRAVRPGRDARRLRRAAGLLDQDPAATLNPLMTVSALVLEGPGRTPGPARALLAGLGLDADALWHRRPGALSGGQAQRVAVARTLLGEPELLVLDEPTGGLDPDALGLVAAAIERRRGDGRSVTLVISHDAAFVARVADRVVRIGPAPPAPRAEAGPEAVPHVDVRPVLEVRGLRAGHGPDVLLDGVSLTLRPGELVAVAGPSGSGKSTLLRTLAGLHPASSGDLRLDGRAVPWPVGARDVTALRGIQFVAQSPATALNPAHRARTAIARPLRRLHPSPHEDARTDARARRRERVAELLTAVGLDPGLGSRKPGELSGGQRQRVAIARALAAAPAVLLADEITSALDPAAADGLLRLLDGLRRHGTAVLLVTHDPAVAARADRVLRLTGRRLTEEPARTEDETHAR